jgi:hypothetical protein
LISRYTPQHACTASLMLANIRQYIDIIERDMQHQDLDPERLQEFAAQLQQDATILADQTRMMNGAERESA